MLYNVNHGPRPVHGVGLQKAEGVHWLHGRRLEFWSLSNELANIGEPIKIIIFVTRLLKIIPHPVSL